MTGIAPFPHGITVKINRGTRNKYGDITRVYSHSIAGCGMAPRYAIASNDNRTSVIVGFSLFGPAGSDILADDEVETPDGNRYRVTGEAAEWNNPMTGWTPGFEAALERVI